MKKLFPLITIALGLFTTSHATTRYVNASATGANDGTSWANAYNSLQTALSAPNVDTLWVANGVYKPTTTTNRQISFEISDKTLYGGFVGTETSLTQRNFSTFQTILDGDIGVIGDSTDNSYSVVKVPGSCNIDGFKIMNGNGGTSTLGGGMYCNQFSDLILRNCFFYKNYAPNGGALNTATIGTTFIEKCIFSENHAGTGGTLYKVGTNGNAYFYDCVFNNNSATEQGGVAYHTTGYLQFNRCTFSGNNAYKGGVMYAEPTGWTATSGIFNSLLVGNTAHANAAVYISPITTGLDIHVATAIYNSTIAANKSLNDSAAVYLNSYSTLRNTIIWGNGNSSNQINANSQGQFNGASLQDNIVQFATGSTAYNFDPMFINPGNVSAAPFNATNYNYHLDSMSLAIDKGNDIDYTYYMPPANPDFPTLYNIDLDGNPRVQNIITDIGCYERGYCVSTTIGNITDDTVVCEVTSLQLTAPSGVAYNWNTGASTNTITVTAPGTYFASIKDASGCIGHYTVNITIPNTTLTISGDTFFCAGQQTQLTAVGNVNSYLWNNGNTTSSISVSQPGNYYVTGTDSFGCSTTSDTISVQETALPTVTISGDTFFCTNGTATLTAAGNANTYLWNNGSTTSAVTVNQAGAYFVTGINTYGCSANSDTISVQEIALPTVTVAGDTFFCEEDSIILTVSGDAINYLWNNGVTTDTITVTQSGDYFVTGTNDHGCNTTSDTISVQEIALPVVTISGDTFFCEGSSTALTATEGAASYLWNTGATTDTISVMQAGNYVVTVTDDYGCSAHSDTLQVTSIPLPQPNVTQYGNALATEIFNSYQWMEGNTDIPGAVGQIYVPATDGVYKVRVTNAEGCEGVSEPFNFTLTGIHETYDQSALQVYPNPAKDHLTVDVSILKSKVESYTIYDIIGKAVIRKDKVDAGQTIRVDLPTSIANGNYILQLNANKETYRTKFLIRK